jgi:hypothetical protein
MKECFGGFRSERKSEDEPTDHAGESIAQPSRFWQYIFISMTPPSRSDTESTTNRRLRHQTIVTDLARKGLESEAFDQFLREAAETVVGVLKTEYATVLECGPSGDEAGLRRVSAGTTKPSTRRYPSSRGLERETPSERTRRSSSATAARTASTSNLTKDRRLRSFSRRRRRSSSSCESGRQPRVFHTVRRTRRPWHGIPSGSTGTTTLRR